MKKTYAVILAIVALCALVHGAEPTHQWKFVDEPRQGRIADTGNAEKKISMSVGEQTTEGARCTDKKFPAATVPMDWPEYTIDIKFKLDEPFVRGKSRGLFNYEFWSWNRRSFRIRIDNEGRLELFAQVTDSGQAEPKFRFQLNSEKLDWKNGEWYIVRVAAKKKGTVRIWRNGSLAAAGNNAPGLDEINDGVKREYSHLIRLGWDTSDPRIPHGSLNGVINEVTLFDRVEEPELSSAAAEENSARYAVVGGEKSWTAPFNVPDRAGHAYGSYVKADNHFIKSAARASISMDNDNFHVSFRCPVPQGMKADTAAESIWKGDSVEFFLRPDLGSPVYFQYAAGANGQSAAFRFSARTQADKSFVSKAVIKVDTSKAEEWTVDMVIPKSEVDCAKLEPGMVISGNFCRSGGTAGGLTSWIPMDSDFHAVDSFGRFIIGGRRDYFNRTVRELKTQLSKYAGAEVTEVAAKIADLEREIAASGDREDAFSRLEHCVGNLRSAILMAAFAGKSCLAWEPDSWGNRFEPMPLTRPLEKIKLTLGQNDRALRGLAFSNLTDNRFLGQIKCFSKWPLQGPGKSFNSEPWNDFLRGIRFQEGIMLQDQGGKPFWDPMAPLPMETLLRVGPHDTALLWLTVSTRNLPPGTYSGEIVIKPAVRGFQATVVKLEVEVLPVDLAQIQVDSFHYAFFTEWPMNSRNHPDLQKLYPYLAGQEANVMFAGHLREAYPEQNPDGTLKPVDWTALDRKINAYIEAGIPRERLKLMFNLHTFIFNWIDSQGNVRPALLKFGTPEFDRGFTDFIKQLYTHLGEKFGLTSDRVIIYTGDEPEGDIKNPESRMFRVHRLGELVRKAVPAAATATNPYPRNGVTPDFLAGLKLLTENHSHMILLPQAQKPEILELFKKNGVTVWTYEVLSNPVAPEHYRKMFYRSFIRKIGSANAYWAIDSYAGGDGFDATDFSGDWKGGYSGNRTDYGSAYCDFNLGSIISGRRAEAHYQGLLDYKLITLAAKLTDGNTEARKELDAIVARGFAGSCGEMDKCHVQLLNLIMKLKQDADK